MSELLPCPFCGGEAEQYDDHDTGSFNEGMSCIQCTRCQASSAMHGDRKENLVSSWNTRATPPVEAPSHAEREPVAAWQFRYKGSKWQNTHTDCKPDFALADVEYRPLYASPTAEVQALKAALTWAIEYLEGYDHTGTGSSPPESFLRDYEEKVETIRIMVGVERANPRWKLKEHFRSALQGEPLPVAATEEAQS